MSELNTKILEAVDREQLTPSEQESLDLFTIVIKMMERLRENMAKKLTYFSERHESEYLQQQVKK